MNRNSQLGGLLRRPEAGALLGLVAVLIFFTIFGGVTFLMVAGELDISVGAMVPFGAMTVAVISGHFGFSIWLGIAVALGFGILVGLVNGYMVVRTAVPSLIVTLGSLFAVQGVVLGLTVLITKSTSVALATDGAAKAIFGDFIMGGQLQAMVFWWFIITGLYIYFVHFSRFGNWIFAMGGDKVSARNAGIPTEKLTITLFVLSSTSAAFVGMCQAILYNSAQVAGGQSYIFNAIIAVVVGGVLLTGGFGSIIGIFFGTITFAVVNQGIYYTDFDRNWSSLIIGILLLVAVLMNNTFRKMALSYSPKKGAKA